HGAAGSGVAEFLLVLADRKLPIEQEVTGFEEIAMFCELLDRVAAIEQNTLVAIDIGDFGLAACGRGVTGIVGEDVGLTVQLGDVDDIRPDGAFVHRKRVALVTQGQCAGLGVGAGACVHAGILDEKAPTSCSRSAPGAEVAGRVEPDLCAPPVVCVPYSFVRRKTGAHSGDAPVTLPSGERIEEKQRFPARYKTPADTNFACIF